MLVVVGLGKMKVSGSEEETLITYSLGSCIGLSLYDPVARVGGLVHCMLPTVTLDPSRAETTPCLFADRGTEELVRGVLELGAQRRRLIAKVAGGANIQKAMRSYNIGGRNYTSASLVLWKKDIVIVSEDVGGSFARTMSLDIASGTTIVKSQLESVDL